MTHIIIWRKSIRDSGGKCPICGAQVTDGSGNPSTYAGIEDNRAEQGEIYCMKCFQNGVRTVVAVYKSVNDVLKTPLQMLSGMNWSEAEKTLKKHVQGSAESYKTINELRRKIDRLEKDNKLLEAANKELKKKAENIKKEKNKQNQKLSKELIALEHRYDLLAQKTMFEGGLND